MTILEARNLYLAYGNTPGKSVVQDACLSIQAGEILSIIGPNGSGKSTLLKGLCRLLKPQSGLCLLNGQDIWQQDTREVARYLAILPQLKKAQGDLQVEQLVSFGRYPHKAYGARLKYEDKEAIAKALQKTRLEGLKDAYVSSLSGGEQQRVWLALALAQEPKILVLDEPTSFLDIAYQLEFMELIKDLNQEDGTTIVMVLHDINQALRYSDRICALKEGKIVALDKAKAVISPGLIEEVYGVKGELTTIGQDQRPYFVAHKSLRI